MAHVKITAGKPGEPTQLIIDGVDMSQHVYAEGLAIVQVGEDDFKAWGVQMIIAADVLEADLPEAVIHAIREGDDHA